MSREDELLEIFKRATNPTGTDHTLTPWKAADTMGTHDIVSHIDVPIAGFVRKEDRDLALYFANSHGAMISLIRDLAGAFDFAALAVDHEATRTFLRERAELTRIYADIFAAMGDTEKARVAEQRRIAAAAEDQPL